jgi:hypothetical protein
MGERRKWGMNELASNPVTATATCLAGIAREDTHRGSRCRERTHFCTISHVLVLCALTQKPCYTKTPSTDRGDNTFRSCTQMVGICFSITHHMKVPVNKIPYCFRSRVAEYVKPSRLIWRLTKF